MWSWGDGLPRVIDLEHFMDNFLARLSNHDPNFWVPEAMEDEKELDLVNSLMSIVVELLCSSRCPDPETDEPDLQSPDPAESGLL